MHFPQIHGLLGEHFPFKSYVLLPSSFPLNPLESWGIETLIHWRRFDGRSGLRVSWLYQQFYSLLHVSSQWCLQNKMIHKLALQAKFYGNMGNIISDGMRTASCIRLKMTLLLTYLLRSLDFVHEATGSH